MERGLHLHRLDRQQHVAGADPLAGLDDKRRNHPRHGGGEVGGIAILRLAAPIPTRRPMGAVGDLGHTRLAVEFKEHANEAVLVGLPHRLSPDHQRLAAFQFHQDFFAGRQAVEEHRRRQHGDRTVGFGGLGEIGEDLGIHQVGRELAVADIGGGLLGGGDAFGFQIGGLQQ